MQHEISAPAPLLRDDGSLTEAGYATYPLLIYDRSAVKGGRMRIKEWDYYLINNDRYAVALTVDDNSYMGLMSVSFIDLEKRSELTKSIIIPLSNGRVKLPASSSGGDVVFKNRRCSFEFLHEGDGRRLKVRYKRFNNGLDFECDLFLFEEPRDSMVIATPFENKKTAFYYNQKIIGMRAKGSVYHNRKEYKFTPGNTFALLDWGRGVWTYENTWLWSAAQGMNDGHKFGFNLGGGFGDTSAASENMLFYDGYAHKLGYVSFDIPKTDFGADDFMMPWHIYDDEGRLDLKFAPTLDRKSKTSLGIIMSDQHQVFGSFSGTAELDAGKRVTLEGFTGFAEKVHNKW